MNRIPHTEAGDVATAVSVIRETLSILKEKFEEVFYCPGWGQSPREDANRTTSLKILDMTKQPDRMIFTEFARPG